MTAKKKLIVALVCANVALVAAVALVATTPPAQAQPGIIGATTYLVAPGRIATDHSALFVVDVARQTLAVWFIDKTSKKFTVLGVRDLKADFRGR